MDLISVGVLRYHWAMKGLMIRLTDDERAELERRRAAGGHRSLNETVKAWLAPAERVKITFVPGTKTLPKGPTFRGVDPVTNEEIWK